MFKRNPQVITRKHVVVTVRNYACFCIATTLCKYVYWLYVLIFVALEPTYAL